MKQRVKHDAELDILTPQEATAMLHAVRERDAIQRVRAASIILLDANGNGQNEVYTVPTGFEFAARRVTLDLDSASDPNTGNVPLNVAGKFVAYLRSGARIEYAVPSSPAGVASVPGVQTWGQQQGPYLRNAEVFEVLARGLTPSVRLSAVLEGILYKPGVGGNR